MQSQMNLGIKDLKDELTKTANEMKEMNQNISKMAQNINNLSSEMAQAMNKMVEALSSTNKSIEDSLKVTSNAIISMKDSFTVALENALDKMTNMSVQMNVKDTLIKSLGLDNILPDFLKKK